MRATISGTVKAIWFGGVKKKYIGEKGTEKERGYFLLEEEGGPRGG